MSGSCRRRIAAVLVRIAVVTHSARQAGGVESYLADLVPRLRGAGHQVAVLAETDRPGSRGRIVVNAEVAGPVEAVGVAAALDALSDWDPSVVLTHGLDDLDLKRRLADRFPTVHFAHDYRSTCVSGYKAWARPAPRPCERRLDWGCLTHYYPHRCGGLDPRTMWRHFSEHTRRLDVLRTFAAVMTNSEHLAREYVRHGFDPAHVHSVSMFVELLVHDSPTRSPTTGPAHLLFAGRMEPHKGGEVLLDALVRVRARSGRDLELTMAGVGSLLPAWERRAREAERSGGISVRFSGWLDRPALGAAMAASDLLILPSTWPEPFGRVGLEAGLLGTPCVAFAVGGIPEWLQNGVNGRVAPAAPPTAAGLALAIGDAVRDVETWTALSAGARAVASRFSAERHLETLVPLLERYSR